MTQLTLFAASLLSCQNRGGRLSGLAKFLLSPKDNVLQPCISFSENRGTPILNISAWNTCRTRAFRHDLVPTSSIIPHLKFRHFVILNLKGASILFYPATETALQRRGVRLHTRGAMFSSFTQRAVAAARVAIPATAVAFGAQYAGASGEDHIEPPKYQWNNGPFSTFDAQA